MGLYYGGGLLSISMSRVGDLYMGNIIMRTMINKSQMDLLQIRIETY